MIRAMAAKLKVREAAAFLLALWLCVIPAAGEARLSASTSHASVAGAAPSLMDAIASAEVSLAKAPAAAPDERAGGAAPDDPAFLWIYRFLITGTSSRSCQADSSASDVNSTSRRGFQARAPPLV